MPQSFSNTRIHIIFSTKHRQPFIDNNIEQPLFGYIGQICNELKCKTIIVGGYKDHIHIFCNLYRPLSQSDLVKEIKTNSSRWMKTQGQEYEDFYWQDGFATYSVSQSQSDNLIAYIKNQRQHHEKKTFKEEYREFLELNNLEFDEKYCWD